MKTTTNTATETTTRTALLIDATSSFGDMGPAMERAYYDAPKMDDAEVAKAVAFFGEKEVTHLRAFYPRARLVIVDADKAIYSCGVLIDAPAA